MTLALPMRYDKYIQSHMINVNEGYFYNLRKEHYVDSFMVLMDKEWYKNI